jgi:uncharacterized protein YkwD
MRDTLFFAGLCVLGVVLFSVFVPSLTASSAPDSDTNPVDSVEAFDEPKIRSLTFVQQNEARQEQGLAEVERNASVDAVAQSWAEEMAQTGYYNHGEFDSRMEENTRCESYGEVISKTQVLNRYTNSSGQEVHLNSERAVAQFLVDSWLDSSQHRLIITDDKFTHVGIGISLTEKGRLYAVMDYCRYPSSS